MRNKKRTLLTVAAVLLILCGVIGTTVAWLIAETEPVKNTFTYGNIDITLDETPVNPDGTPDVDGTPVTENEYNIVPGKDYYKDPTVTVEANSENAWLFVKLDESEGFDNYMEYTVDTSVWTALEGVENVYYLEYTKNTAAVEYEVLVDNLITAKSSVTKAEIDALAQNGNYPTLTLTAYAVQKEAGATASAAWEVALANQ